MAKPEGGLVHAGRWKGLAVAVKVLHVPLCDGTFPVGECAARAYGDAPNLHDQGMGLHHPWLREVAVAVNTSHPNLVCTRERAWEWVEGKRSRG
jgi:hypothetical protein